MKTYKIYAERIIEAENEQEARDTFIDNCWDFSSEYEIEEITDREYGDNK